MMRRSALFIAALGALMLVGAGMATAGDHLKCYKVKDTRNIQVDPANAKRVVNLTSNTGLNPEPGCTVDNRKAVYCCDAVDKTPGGPPPGTHITNRFCCYKLRCPKPNPNPQMFVSDQFRSGLPVTNTAPAFLCAPGN
jgi:hypothetical protein